MKKNLLISLASVVITASFAILFGEIYIRLFFPDKYITPEIRKNQSLQYEPALGAIHVFPQKELIAELNVEGWEGIKYYINENGYRGHNFTIEKPEGTIRIIIYGGSGVFDPGAPQGKDWPHRVENILRQDGFPNVEVINAGIPGHNSWDSFGRLFSEGHIFNPDYVILYNAWNDLKYFRSNKPVLRTFKPYNNTFDPRINYRNSIDRFFGENSQLYVRLRDKYYQWKFQIGSEGRKPVGEYSSEVSQLGLKQYKLNVQMFVDLARNIGATPILMTQGRLVTQNNTEEQRERISYEYVLLTHQALYETLNETDNIIRQVAREKNVPFIDASTQITGRDELFIDHVHLTEKGSEELANIVAQAIAELLTQER